MESVEDIDIDENLVKELTESFKAYEKFEIAVREFLILYEKDEGWDAMRNKTIEEIQQLANHIDRVHHKTNISHAVASSSGIVGGGMILSSLAMAPFTFGASLMLFGAGVATSTVAGVASLGSSITETTITKATCKKAQNIFDKDQEWTTELFSYIEVIHKEADILYNSQKKLEAWSSEDIKKVIKYIGLGLTTSSSAAATYSSVLMLRELTMSGYWSSFLEFLVYVPEGWRQGLTKLFGINWTATQAALNTAPAFMSSASRLLGGITGVIGVGFDIYTLVTVSLELKNGSHAEATNKLTELCMDMKTEQNKVGEYYKNLKHRPVPG